MRRMVFIQTADRRATVGDLVNLNASLGGENYLDMRSGDIVRVVEGKLEAQTEEPKKKKKG